MSVTAQDIATQTGLSLPTVYEALRGTGRMRATTRQQVLDTARKLGYRPNRAAANMKRGRHGAIGLLVNDWWSLPKYAINSLVQELQQHDYFLLLEQVAGDTTPRLLREDCIDGLILFETLDESHLSKIHNQDLPLIEVNTNRRTATGCIRFDEAGAMETAARQFHAASRTRPAILHPRWSSQHVSMDERSIAFAKACADLGMAPPACGIGASFQDHDDLDGTSTARFLNEHPDLDCILLAHDNLAPLLYQQAAQRKRRIPEDLSVIAINDYATARILRPQLTSLRIELGSLAKTIVTMLESWIMHDRPPRADMLPYQLIERQSVSSHMPRTTADDAARNTHTPPIL